MSTLIHHEVARFLFLQDGRPWIQSWLDGGELPEAVFLRTEPDNEERLSPMGRFGD